MKGKRTCLQKKTNKTKTVAKTKEKMRKTSSNTTSKTPIVQRKPTIRNAAGKQDKREKPFCCRLNHRNFLSYKAESNKKWFGEKQRFEKSECFICKKNIGTKSTNDTFVPSVSKPAYICVNSTKDCKKCVCHFCCVKLMINDNSSDTNNNRRSKRKRS